MWGDHGRAQYPRDTNTQMKGSDLMSPRRNTKGYSRRRTTRRPEAERTEAAVNYESLANKLVRRGLATPAILTGATYYPRATALARKTTQEKNK